MNLDQENAALVWMETFSRNGNTHHKSNGNDIDPGYFHTPLIYLISTPPKNVFPTAFFYPPLPYTNLDPQSSRSPEPEDFRREGWDGVDGGIGGQG